MGALNLPSTAEEFWETGQEGLAVASIARDDSSTLPGDDPSPRARMHRDRNARKIGIGIWNLN